MDSTTLIMVLGAAVLLLAALVIALRKDPHALNENGELKHPHLWRSNNQVQEAPDQPKPQPKLRFENNTSPVEPEEQSPQAA